MTPASAVLREGNHAPIPLHGTPAVAPASRPGEVTIVLGYMNCGNCGTATMPVTVTLTSLEWAEDLESAARVAWAGGIVPPGMDLAVVR